MKTLLAFDKKSARHYDANGFLHVDVCNISKEDVNAYFGEEIPGWETLGLDPKKSYMMYRPGDELAKAAKTFNNMSLFLEHPEDAVTPENPEKEQKCGSLGTDCVFVSPFLQNSLVVDTAEGIAGVEDETCVEISSSYSYDPDMTPGEFNGLHYDGRMVNIAANHVALVPEGRAGPDVIVSDASPKGMQMLKPKRLKLAKDLKAKFAAKDADIDLNEIVELLAQAEGDPATDEDINSDPAAMDSEAATEYLKGILSDEQLAEYTKLCSAGASDGEGDEGEGNEPPKPASDGEGDEGEGNEPPKPKALDAVAIRKGALAEFQAIRTAEKAVFPIIGEVKVAMDSAAAVYRLALDARKVRHRGITDPRALAAMVQMLPSEEETSSTVFAADSAEGSPLDAIAKKAIPLKRS